MAANFLGIDEEYSSYGKSKIVILPIPYDKTSTYGKGADKGPDAIINASSQVELYDIETDSEVHINGIHTRQPLIVNNEPDILFKKVYDNVLSMLKDDKFVVCLGGEHSISIGTIKAHIDHFKEVSVLQLDAHGDTRDTYHGSEYNHACVMARVMEWTKPTQVGIRSMDSSEKENVLKNNVFFAHNLHKDKLWIDKVIGTLKHDKVYITLDLDVFDPSIMPSTGTPEPDGLTWEQVNDLINKLTSKKKIIGFDVVELAPKKDYHAPDFIAAKLIHRILSQVFSKAHK